MSPVSLARLRLTLEHRAYTALRSFADRRSPLPPHLLTGERGEDAAFFHLRGLGYTIVARRWRSPRLPGDLDLVAWDGDVLVIFEIKTRTAPSREQAFAPAEAEVDVHKQTMLRRMAASYLSQLPAPHRASVPLRFDVLAVYLLPAGPEFDHIPNAFPRAEPPRPHWR